MLYWGILITSHVMTYIQTDTWNPNIYTETHNVQLNLWHVFPREIVMSSCQCETGSAVSVHSLSPPREHSGINLKFAWPFAFYHWYYCFLNIPLFSYISFLYSPVFLFFLPILFVALRAGLHVHCISGRHSVKQCHIGQWDVVFFNENGYEIWYLEC